MMDTDETIESTQVADSKWWALQNSNLRPLPCQGSRAVETNTAQSLSDSSSVQESGHFVPESGDDGRGQSGRCEARAEGREMMFFCGLHQPSDAKHVSPSFVSVNRLRNRKSDFAVGDWIMDSGAFSELFRYGKYRHSVKEYADQVRRWKDCGNLLAAVAQDYMCEPFIVRKTGLSVREHQRRTIQRYDSLLAEETGVYIMPVLQGYTVDDYILHIAMYGDRLKPGMWVGVGSVCKRNSNPCEIFDILYEIKQVRPDFLLHGFGLKLTALSSSAIRHLLHTADSMAWSYSARRNGRNGNDWREALSFLRRIQLKPLQMHLIEGAA